MYHRITERRQQHLKINNLIIKPPGETKQHHPPNLSWTPFLTVTESKAWRYTVKKLSHPSFHRCIAKRSTPSWSKLASKTVVGVGAVPFYQGPLSWNRSRKIVENYKVISNYYILRTLITLEPWCVYRRSERPRVPRPSAGAPQAALARPRPRPLAHAE